MLQIIADGKQYQLSDLQVVTVQRISLQDYYLLIVSLFIYKNALLKMSGIKEDFESIKNNSIEIAKIKVEFENIKKYLSGFVDINLEKFDNKIIIEIMNCVLDFNSVKFGMGGKEFQNLDEINESLESIVGLVSFLLNVGPEFVLQMDNYQVGVLLREHNRNRINQINDIRLAYHGNKQDYTKYTRGLMGEKVYSAEEIMNDPSILQGVH